MTAVSATPTSPHDTASSPSSLRPESVGTVGVTATAIVLTSLDGSVSHDAAELGGAA